jgi:hypothetical protein
MLSGVTVLAASVGILAVIWAFVLVGPQAFGSPPEH